MGLNLTDVFEAVLKSAIEAQFNANEYSAELAEKQKEKAQKMLVTSDGAKKVIANPYYPIPNSNLQGVGVKFKVKFEEIETDIERSHAKIIRHIQVNLDKHLPHLRQINAFTKSRRLSRELMKCNVTDPINVHDLTIQYFTLYLYLFWKKLDGRDQSAVADFNELALLEAAVFEETCRNLKTEQELHDVKYQEIRLTVQALASGSSILKNIRLSIADGLQEENLMASIEMNVDMRTFSWESYGQE